MSHPLHPALVHFPIAAWTLATLLDAVGWAWPAPWLQSAAALLLAAGCGFGVLAAAVGWWELFKLPAEHPGNRVAVIHMSLALASLGLYAGSLYLRLDLPQQRLLPTAAWALALSAAGWLLLLATGWMGGQLVYRHGVGVMPRG